MKDPVVWFALGLAGGILVGSALKQCPKASSGGGLGAIVTELIKGFS